MVSFFGENWCDLPLSTSGIILAFDDANLYDDRDFDSHEKIRFFWKFLQQQKEYRYHDPSGERIITTRYIIDHRGVERTTILLMFGKNETIKEIYKRCLDADDLPELRIERLSLYLLHDDGGFIKQNLCEWTKDSICLTFYWVKEDP